MVAVLIYLVLLLPAWNADEASLGDQIVEFARSNLGRKVGDGECTTLAVRALRHSGARRPAPALGLWGDAITSLADVQPGDILQFEDVLFVKQRRRRDRAVLTQTLSFPHHTAIVAGVKKKGLKPVLLILHQNAGMDGDDDAARRLVQEATLDMATKREGSVHAFRPVPADRRTTLEIPAR